MEDRNIDKSKSKKDKPIELRSEEVQEVMGQIPVRIVRWGITVLFIVVLVILIGSCFFRYPDVITTEMTLTGRYPAAAIVARSSGKISRLYVSDGERVEAGRPLAVIENPAVTEDILSLKALLAQWGNEPDSLLTGLSANSELALGDVQTVYASFLRSVNEYGNYVTLDYYPRRIGAVRDQIDKYRHYSRNLERQQQVIEAQYAIASQQHARDSLLFAREVIAPSEYETARSTFLQSRHTLEGASASLSNLSIQIASLEASLLDLELQQAEKESQLRQDLQTTAGQLTNAIHSWELTYCLTSPINGKVTFTKYWNDLQFIPTGENIFTVVPDEGEELVGKSLLPVQRSGKVRTGQRVIVRFLNYPDQEFGIVNGVVSSISLVPSDNNYMVEIAFPEGLTTNYGRHLPLAHEMQASAEIVTADLRLIERFFMPLKRALKEGLEFDTQSVGQREPTRT